MNILFVHQHFKTPTTGGAIRSYYLAKALVDRGHRVVVITAHNDKAKIFTVDGIEVHYLPVQYDNRFKAGARSFAFAWFVIRASLRAIRFRNFDRLYAISTPLTVGLTARFLKLVFGIPYFFEVGDLWPDAPIEMGFVPNKRLQRILFSLEALIYREAEALIALSPAIAAMLEKKIPGKPIHLIPNMSDCEFYFPMPRRQKTEELFGTRDKFVISYIGALGIANGLERMLVCAREILDNPSVQFLVAGDGAQKEFIQHQVRQQSLSNVRLIDFVDRAGVQEIMEVTDAMFISYQSFPILSTGSPNKYFDGLAGGKLIIVNFPGWISEEIEAEGCGFYVHANNQKTFVDQLTPYLHDRTKLLNAQKKARTLAENKYARMKLSIAFADLFQPRSQRK
ncbi:MAG TPA: glycosyltransferase family 4 protein [Cyclobacteriaceae bacterium]|nr:glycosyltransferase family 4 protein [Cyclobacteriaceae bacterium]